MQTIPALISWENLNSTTGELSSSSTCWKYTKTDQASQIQMRSPLPPRSSTLRHTRQLSVEMLQYMHFASMSTVAAAVNVMWVVNVGRIQLLLISGMEQHTMVWSKSSLSVLASFSYQQLTLAQKHTLRCILVEIDTDHSMINMCHFAHISTSSAIIISSIFIVSQPYH